MQRRNNQPRGFTLVELLIVITVLAILVGLLIPAVNAVRIRVRHAAVQSEINRIATAVTAFKTQYGSEPPSYITLCEGPTGANGWTSFPRDRAILRQLWPQFDFTMSRDLNGDGDTNDIFELEPGETLVFFLGGLPQVSSSGTTTSFTLLGFAKNPQNPFSMSSSANREKSAYDFDSSRLVDLDSDGFPEFLDSYPGQTNPILYFSSYDGNGYRLAEYPGGSFPSRPYLQQLGTLNNNGTPSDPTDDFYVISPSTTAFNAKSFQLISPGMDHEYGPGGPYAASPTPMLPAWNTSATAPPPSQSVLARRVERDNITNFGNGPLVP